MEQKPSDGRMICTIPRVIQMLLDMMLYRNHVSGAGRSYWFASHARKKKLLMQAIYIINYLFLSVYCAFIIPLSYSIAKKFLWFQKSKRAKLHV